MLCPSCSYTLQKLSVSTNQGGRFDVDHCGRCGGTWFDPYEINRIPFHEVVNLANLTVNPKIPVKTSGMLLCPNDRSKLESFKGEAVPRNVRLLWCRKCLGLWATQKDLLEFKKHQEDTLSAYDQGEKFFPSLSVVFIPAMTFLFLLITTFSTITFLSDARDERIIAESRITDLQTRIIYPDSVIISFNTSVPVSAFMSYGPSSLEMTSIKVTAGTDVSHSIFLTGLNPNSGYLYRLTLTDLSGRSYTTDLKSFSLSR